MWPGILYTNDASDDNANDDNAAGLHMQRWPLAKSAQKPF